jgi:hypothetical protein
MKRCGEPAAIEQAYEEWPGEEFVIEIATACSSSRRSSHDRGSAMPAISRRDHWHAGATLQR